MSDQSTTILVPKEPTLFRTTGIPPKKIELPFYVNSSNIKNILSIIIILVIISAITNNLINMIKSFPTKDLVLFFSVLFVIYAALLIFSLYVLLTSIIGACQNLLHSPVLVITEKALLDTRSKTILQWNEIEQATIDKDSKGTLVGIILLAKTTPATGQQRTATIPLRLLDCKVYILVHAIMTMVERHGGRVVR
ncbi:hypothetical protein [Bosea sp. RAC05]|uniref:hypothetical protein n=1 Tax=Bosea sp. RAC05 TaxID=1842539 RepID=UPI00123797A3|nr:hypothetical protein [Bosea sp. RAC05]